MKKWTIGNRLKIFLTSIEPVSVCVTASETGSEYFFLPACFYNARDHAGIGHLAEAETGKFELTKVSSCPAS